MKMLSFGKAKRVVNLVIEDYVIRMVENNGKDLASIKFLAEKTIPTGLVQDGKVIDDEAFYEFMKEIVVEWGIKGESVRFYVPHSMVIMRDINITEYVIPSEIKQYITMEIGHTIHFPFSNPIFDVYSVQGTEKVEKVTVLAASEEEIRKYTTIFRDVKLKPIAVDVQTLGSYRYFYDQQKQVDPEQVTLFLELNLTSSNISIFRNHYMEFLRYQALNISKEDWQSSREKPIQWMYAGEEDYLFGAIDEQLNEIERIMNFYQFSIQQGERAVTDIVLLGDIPQLGEVVPRLQERYLLPVTTLSVGDLTIKHSVSPAFIPALGLALKGGNADG